MHYLWVVNDAACSYTCEQINNMKIIVTNRLIELETYTDIIEGSIEIKNGWHDNTKMTSSM